MISITLSLFALFGIIYSQTIPTEGNFVFQFSSDAKCSMPTTPYMGYTGSSNCWMTGASSSIAPTGWNMNTTTLTINAYDNTMNCSGTPSSFGPINCDGRCLQSSTISSVYFRCFYSLPQPLNVNATFAFKAYNDNKCSEKVGTDMSYKSDNSCWNLGAVSLTPIAYDKTNSALKAQSFNTTLGCTQSALLAEGYLNCNNQCQKDFVQGNYYTCNYSGSFYYSFVSFTVLILSLFLF